jgi:hypothetical protein
LTGQPESAVNQPVGIGPFSNLSVLTRVHIGRQLLFFDRRFFRKDACTEYLP